MRAALERRGVARAGRGAARDLHSSWVRLTVRSRSCKRAIPCSTSSLLTRTAGEVGEGALILEPCDAFGVGLEGEPQRPLDGHLAEAEVRGGEELGCRTLRKAAQLFDDLARLLEADLAELVAQALAHGPSAHR